MDREAPNGTTESLLRRWTPSLVVFAVALAVRAAYLHDITASPLTDVLLIDSETYERFARKILAGTFRGEEVYAVNVLYPYFLAALYRLGVSSWTGILPVQAVLDSAGCALLCRAGGIHFGRPAGLLAGLLAATYGPFVFYSGALLTPSLIGLFCLAALFLLVLYGRRPRALFAAGAGIAIGLAALGRGNSILLVLAAAACFLTARQRRRRGMRNWLLLSAGALILLAAVTVRNYTVEKKLVPVAANYAAFYIGHHPGATGLYSMPAFVQDARFEGEVLGTRDWVSRSLGRPVTIAESSRVLLRWGLAHIREDPRGALVRTFRKFYYFWNRTESPTNLNYHFALDFSPVLRALPIGLGVIAPLALLGMAFTLRRWRAHLFLYLYMTVYLVTCLVFFVSAEYRLPAVPVLILFAAYGILRLGRLARRASRRTPALPGRPALTLGLALLSLLPLSAFVNYRTPLLEAQTWKRVDYLNFGNLYRRGEEYEKARAMLSRSLEIDPRFGPAWRALAVLQRRLGNDLAAARSFERARRYALGGQYEAEEKSPMEEGSPLLRVARLYEAGEYEEALEGFEALRAERESMGDTAVALRARNNIGLCLYKLGRFDEASDTYRALLAAHPSYIKGYTNLAKVEAARGRVKEAERLYGEALRLDPRNPRIRADLERLRHGIGSAERSGG